MITAIVIQRAHEGWRDRYRSYEVIVNGERRADLWRGEATAIEVDPGEVEIYIKIDWCKSRSIRMNMKAGSEKRLFCRPGSLLTGTYGVTLGRNNYVRIEQIRTEHPPDWPVPEGRAAR